MALSEKEKARKARWDQFVDWYRVNVTQSIGRNVRRPIPEELKKLYMANSDDGGGWSTERAMMWIRGNDPNYLRTETATSRMTAIQQLYEKSYGYSINWKQPKWKAVLEGFAKGNPNIDITLRLNQIFMKKILPSKKFQNKEPGFVAWLKNNPGANAKASIIDALADYQTEKETLAAEWASYTDIPMPKELLDTALKNGWHADSVAFKKAISNSKEWAASAGYDARAKDFDEQWKAVFGDSVPVDPVHRDNYSKSLDKLTFEDYFQSTLKYDKVFKDRFPGYTAWEEQQHGAGGPEGTVDVFDYFDRRKELEEMWYANFTGGELPNQAFIDEAMAGNYGDALFLNKLRRLPEYAKSGDGKQKAAQFDNYWRGMFGDTAVPDETIRSNYIASEAVDPSAYWDDIKLTDAFKATFTNWDVFATAQANAGVNVNEDPMAYKEYSTAMKNAFANIGIEMPTELERTIFSSGVSGQDLQSRAEDWNTAKEAYQLQQGEKASLTDAMGVTTDQAKSADMRSRLQKALEKQKTYSQSKFATAQTKTENELVTQKI